MKPAVAAKLAFLRENAGKIPITQMARQLGCDAKALRKLAANHAIGVTRPRGICGVSCPECKRNGRVLETRRNANGTTRRRYVDTQGHRWSTIETLLKEES